MKRYHQHYDFPTTDVNTSTKVFPSKDSGAPSDNVAGAFPYGGLSVTHVLTSPWSEQHDRFLDVCFKEWEEWIQNYYLSRPEKLSTSNFLNDQDHDQ